MPRVPLTSKRFFSLEIDAERTNPTALPRGGVASYTVRDGHRHLGGKSRPPVSFSSRVCFSSDVRRSGHLKFLEAIPGFQCAQRGSTA